MFQWRGGGGGNPTYFLHRDVSPVRVSRSVLKRGYDFTFLCLKDLKARQSFPISLSRPSIA